jgi:hypothetical protein
MRWMDGTGLQRPAVYSTVSVPLRFASARSEGGVSPVIQIWTRLFRLTLFLRVRGVPR